MLIANPKPNPKPQTTATLKGIPNGGAGTRATLKAMAKIISHAKKNIHFRELALSIVADEPRKCWSCEAKKIQQYVYNNIRYVRDIDGIETLSTPEKTLEYKQGDCDDVVILAATLLQSIGHPVRLIAVGFGRQSFSHVLLETLIGDKWAAMELTEPLNLGEYPPNINKKMTVHVK